MGQDPDLLAVKLDVTEPGDAEAAVRAAVARFGRIDVLVNNAGNFYAGSSQSSGRSAPVSSSRSRRPPASWGRSSALRMPPPRSRWAHAADRHRLERHERKQGGDPANLATALIRLAGVAEPPLRFVASADAVGAVEKKAADLLAQIYAHRELSSHLAHEEA